MDKYFLDNAFEFLWPESSYPYDIDTHPTAQCAKALAAYNKGDISKFLEYADWLVENQNPITGAWEFKFDWVGGGYEARAPFLQCYI